MVGIPPVKITEEEKRKSAYLATLSTNKRVEEQSLSDFKLMNGMTMKRTNNGYDYLYIADSQMKTFSEFEYYSPTNIKYQRNLLKKILKRRKGQPTGITFDNEGYLWMAIDNEGVILRVDIDREEIVDTVEIECPYITGISFGGDNLYVTTSRFQIVDRGSDEASGSKDSDDSDSSDESGDSDQSNKSSESDDKSGDKSGKSKEKPKPPKKPKSTENCGGTFVVEGLGVSGMANYYENINA